MKFKELHWIDNYEGDLIISSNCRVKIYDCFNIEFRIWYQKKDNVYEMYSFGKGNIRRLEPDRFESLDEAKTAAYDIYNNELTRMKIGIDSFLLEESKK